MDGVAQLARAARARARAGGGARGFNWPGPWLALLRAADDGERIGAVAFGSPPGLAWNPLGGPETFEAVELGYVVAPADVALWAPGLPAAAAAPAWSRPS